MKGFINIAYPESLANALKLQGQDFIMEMKTASVVKLYELGRISSAVASKVLGLSRVEFLELLSKYKVSMFSISDMDDLNEDISNA